MDRSPAEVLEAFERLTKLKSPNQIAAESDLSLSTAKRWKKGGGKRDLPTGKVLEQMAAYVERLEVKEGQDVSRGTMLRESRVEYVFDRDSPERQLVDMLGIPDALRRMAGHVPPSDLVAAAMQLAIDDGWSEERREKLARLCFELLENAKNRG
jgi:hypothetical protein